MVKIIKLTDICMLWCLNDRQTAGFGERDSQAAVNIHGWYGLNRQGALVAPKCYFHFTFNVDQVGYELLTSNSAFCIAKQTYKYIFL